MSRATGLPAADSAALHRGHAARGLSRRERQRGRAVIRACGRGNGRARQQGTENLEQDASRTANQTPITFLAARRPRWLAPLAACDVVLVAFDSDEPGEEAAAYWLNILPKARRWRPYFGKDANGLATSGGDVAAWILDGLGSAPW